MKTIPRLLICTAVLAAMAGCAELRRADIYADPVSSDGVTAEAQSRLSGDPMTARATLVVRVDNGTAVLSGMVSDEATRQRAISILNGTPGVFAVEDRTIRQ
jgi:osmotically-inducible protein OsmY